jgi:hypothetical protein
VRPEGEEGVPEDGMHLAVGLKTGHVVSVDGRRPRGRGGRGGEGGVRRVLADGLAARGLTSTPREGGVVHIHVQPHGVNGREGSYS